MAVIDSNIIIYSAKPEIWKSEKIIQQARHKVFSNFKSRSTVISFAHFKRQNVFSKIIYGSVKLSG